MPQLPRRIVIAQMAALLAVLCVVIPTEVEHWRESQQPGASWFVGIYDTTLPLLLIVGLPYFYLVRRPFWSPDSQRWESLKAWWTRRPCDWATDVHASKQTIDDAYPLWEFCHRRLRSRWTILAAMAIVVASLAVSSRVLERRVGEREQYVFDDLPPAYHDEYSYIVQAKTYLAGRLFYPSHSTAARVFDQMHVLNEGRFASRYFPGTGLFIAPWLWFGWPILGHFLAGAATGVLVFGIGRELSNNGTGFVAGMLTALSPGMALFSNLLLAHHPTLVGLFFFAWSFLRWQRTNRVRDMAFAGVGLSWAMLCRPMTAAGFGLPFGIVFVAKLLRLWSTQTRSVSEVLMVPDPRWRNLKVRFLSRFLSHEVATENSRGLQPPENESKAPLSLERATQRFEPKASVAPSGLGDCDTNETGGLRPRLPPAAASRLMTTQLTTLHLGLVSLHLLAMAVPLVVGFAVLAAHNRAITGSVLNSPYQLFTDIYTPRHVYGFNNVVRGEQHLGPRVLDNYDRWAVNLTPALAVENTKNRLLASWQWTVGIVPLLAATVVFVLTGSSRDRRWWLIFASIVTLFAVHVPYWFVGMFNWHYVFETGPLWCLLLAAATDTLVRDWLAAERPRVPVWWALVIVSAVAVNLTGFSPLWYPSKLELAVENVAFSRLRYQAFNELVQREVRDRPALVLIEADPSDRHIDYVVNEPSLSADVLRGRFPVADWPLERISAEFPDRALYLFRAKTGELRLLTRRELQNAK